MQQGTYLRIVTLILLIAPKVLLGTALFSICTEGIQHIGYKQALYPHKFLYP
jgi:hypothetical protein